MPLLTELHYCPSAAWFATALASGGVLLECHEHYQKQTFRNRALVLTAQGAKALTVPVRGGASQDKKLTAEIEIDYSHEWLLPHWRTLQTAYNRSPYFLYYGDALRAELNRRPATLWELNTRVLKLLTGWIAPALPIGLTDRWQKAYPEAGANGVLDCRNAFAPGVAPDRMRVPPYPQVFGSAFVGGLSVLDLLFALGPGTAAFLRTAAAEASPVI